MSGESVTVQVGWSKVHVKGKVRDNFGNIGYAYFEGPEISTYMRSMASGWGGGRLWLWLGTLDSLLSTW